MGKRYSKQAWISREGPEGDCVIENDTTNSCSTSSRTAEETCKAPGSHTADFTYRGYPVNLEWPFEAEEKDDPKKGFYYDEYPLEVVELPDLPDGKNIELTFERGLVEVATQTKPLRGEFRTYQEPLMPFLHTVLQLAASRTRDRLVRVEWPVRKHEINEGGMSVKSTESDHQEWLYTLYDFEEQGQVTREDLKNLVKSIYEVLGKSVTQSRNQPRDPLKKLRVRLSVSKERGRDAKCDISSRHEYMISASTTRERSRKTRTKPFPVERRGSMTVNPPSLENILDIGKMHYMVIPMDGLENCQSHSHKTTCKKCDQSRASKLASSRCDGPRTGTLVDEQGAYHCPKRMQTGPGECNPPSPKQSDLSRVTEWVNQLYGPHEGHELERTESHHQHRKSHRHHCEPSHDLHRCPQYLDLATDHITYPYHVQSQGCLYAAPSPRPQHRQKHNRGHHHSCKYREETTCHNTRTVVHRHEHHHQHSHHHYHHYID